MTETSVQVDFAGLRLNNPVYTVLQDEIGEGQSVEIGGFDVRINTAQYKKKVEQFVRLHEDHIVIHKLKFNEPLTPKDLSELERFLYDSTEVQSRSLLEQAFGKKKLSVFIRSLLGLERGAAKKAFAKYLDSSQFSTNQIRFIDMIIDHLTQQGIMDAGLLYEQPFTSIHYEGLDGVFESAVADEIVSIVHRINANADGGTAA